MGEITKFSFELKSYDEAMKYSKMIADSDLAPKDFKGKPGNVFIAIQMGVEIGLKPMQAIQNIAVINGRPCLWGDAMLGVVRNHHEFEAIKEEVKNDTAYCTIKRRGEEEYTYSFSKDEAKTAGLLGKAGPWTQYPKRMLQMRARSFALRDKFADVLKGINMAEEVMDYQEGDFKVVQCEATNDLNQSLGLIESKPEITYNLSAMTKALNDCTSLGSLQEAFKAHSKTVKANQDHLNILIELKDKRKAELEITDKETNDEWLAEYDDKTGEVKI